MKLLVTGSAGRIGRALCARLRSEHELIGLDCMPSASTDVVGSVEDAGLLRGLLQGVDAVVHAAALHAPHVGLQPDEAFEALNVQATAALATLAAEAGARHFVFTSTTALYGAGGDSPGCADWVDESTLPRPRTVYHRSKLAAEARLERLAVAGVIPVTVIRMSRCFPEPAPHMAVYRLHRGVDARDVAQAHALVLQRPAPGFRRYVVSGAPPFGAGDVLALATDAPALIRRRCPALAEAFARRGWALPAVIDRVYSPARIQAELGWQAQHGFDEVLAQLDRHSPEVLRPVRQDSGGLPAWCT